MENKAFITVLVPTYNEEKYISLCVDSILEQDYQKDLMEVFFIDGKSTDKTKEIISEYIKKYSFFFLLENPHRIVPKALNIGIKKAKGEFIIRLDAHSKFPQTYFSKLVEASQKLNADNVGGVCITDVKNKTLKSLAIREVLSNRFGVGNSMFRVGANKITEVDTVVFGCFKKEVFEKYGLFDERLVRNQDIELNKRIKNNGGKLYIIPEVECTYFARENYRGLSENNFKNGYWNILTVYYTKNLKSLSFRHFTPLLFLLSLLIPSLLAVFFTPFIYISIISLGIYLFFLLIVSLNLSINKKLNLPLLLVSFIILHISYGLGSLYGILKVVLLRIHGNRN